FGRRKRVGRNTTTPPPPRMRWRGRCHAAAVGRAGGGADGGAGLGCAVRAAARRRRCRRSCQARPTAATTAAVWVAVRIHQVIATPPRAGCRGCGGSRRRSCPARGGRASADHTGRRAGRRPRRRGRRTTAGLGSRLLPVGAGGVPDGGGEAGGVVLDGVPGLDAGGQLLDPGERGL